ncbi:hypothetical protein AB833_04510 [Chromatiales bacterium (ex Bugula neritina AB1)]|nr:hypothetical protein AB833_04510 [Chromatiales bacterium (ex Bugula neritina AB1)]
MDYPVTESPIGSQPNSKPVVLLVDDDIAGLIMASEALAGAGFDVVEAENGLQAVEQFLTHQPDIIIMDVIMPVMDGFESCIKIRQQNGGQHVPVLMVTGLDDVESIQKAYDVGATDFVTKPINFFLLPHRVHYMMRAARTATELRASQTRLDKAQRIAKLGHWAWSIEEDTIDWSSECQNILDTVEMGSSLDFFLSTVHPDDRQLVSGAIQRARTEAQRFSIEFRTCARKKDDIRIINVEAEPEQIGHMVGTIQDITERSNAEEQIHNLAYYDLVTGLPNRAHLYDMISLSLSQAHRFDSQFALLFLDLDHFKKVNDTLGHNAGDLLLREVSTRLKTAVRQSDVVARSVDQEIPHSNIESIARLGGDEFVVLLSRIERIEDAASVARRICKEIATSFLLDGNEVRITTTVGISLYPSDGNDVDTLLKHADVAMYHAKEQGRNGYQFYSEDIHQIALERFSLERDLRLSLENNGFHLEYQPKVAANNKGLTGAEALVRWQHPERGRVNPGDFIPLAEETGLIVPLGEWVLRTACQQMAEWLNAGMEPFVMAVNCSAIQLVRTDMAAVIKATLEATGLNPEYLEIELTESLLMQNVEEGIVILQALQELGLHVSIDDFGTGFSSLSYLKRLPVDKLKIDQSFVRDLTTDPGDAAIVTSMISLAHNLSLTVVAEGVETTDQLEFLQKKQCDEIQGYLISRPMPAENFAEWATTHQSQTLKLAS